MTVTELTADELPLLDELLLLQNRWRANLGGRCSCSIHDAAFLTARSHASALCCVFRSAASARIASERHLGWVYSIALNKSRDRFRADRVSIRSTR
jgi:hypothetical protein